MALNHQTDLKTQRFRAMVANVVRLVFFDKKNNQWCNNITEQYKDIAAECQEMSQWGVGFLVFAWFKIIIVVDHRIHIVGRFFRYRGIKPKYAVLKPTSFVDCYHGNNKGVYCHLLLP